MYFATRKERRRKRDLGRGSRGMTGLVRSGDDPAANERVRHGAGRGTSDMWTGLERFVRPWATLIGRKTCECLSMLDGVLLSESLVVAPIVDIGSLTTQAR